MAWLLVGVAVVILWMVSLYKVLYSTTKSSFLPKGEGGQTRNVLLVIAHPDDESMFFSPTILYLASGGHNLHVLCLSTGNSNGMGNTRKEELYQACAALKVPLNQVKILDHPDLQDGFGKAWSRSFLATIIEEEIRTQGIDLLLTFDSYGVSGHQNHRDVHHGIRTLLKENMRTSIEAWELVSTSIFRKYSGPVDIWLSMLCSTCYKREEMYCITNQHPSKSFTAMAQHRSQWIWFRKLFVSFSSYTYLNTLRRITI